MDHRRGSGGEESSTPWAPRKYVTVFYIHAMYNNAPLSIKHDDPKARLRSSSASARKVLGTVCSQSALVSDVKRVAIIKPREGIKKTFVDFPKPLNAIGPIG